MAFQASTNGPALQALLPERSDPLPRGSRPNYNQIHALPIPLTTYPFPPLIPHNPLSLLQIAYIYISQVLRPPCSHPSTRYTAYISPETLSIHVTDSEATRALWRMGFFGKGSLSRSEPSWLDREMRRRGLLAGETSEEVTSRRRDERKEFKKERARKEREAIDEKLRQEGKVDPDANGAPVVNGHVVNAVNGHLSGLIPEHEDTESRIGQGDLDHKSAKPTEILTDGNSSPLSEIAKEKKPTQCMKAVRFSPPIEANEMRESSTVNTTAEVLTSGIEEAKEIQNQEHLQLTFEESFFLVYGLGVLNVIDQGTNTLVPITGLLSLFRRNSYSPPCSPSSVKPDDPFLVSYVTYHHFRSLGWVVRPGVKFAIDYLLYNRGPVFSHAEFAVMIIPSYSHPYWTATPARREETQKKESKGWWWLHCVNRVQSQVRKSLILAYIEVPPPEDERTNTGSDPPVNDVAEVGRSLKQYKIREVSLKRWIPNRSRD
ncbi:MAG: hypothetical protein M1830_004062 [Pleopsidium flavum]|nr:MAG: hypothetical protein M1830_004082 [Pleopsidium flavum]KAI9877383.1 MAG: hypothetical protein M1830_004062 [Pleopsidium flavum]